MLVSMLHCYRLTFCTLMYKGEAVCPPPPAAHGQPQMDERPQLQDHMAPEVSCAKTRSCKAPFGLQESAIVVLEATLKAEAERATAAEAEEQRQQEAAAESPGGGSGSGGSGSGQRGQRQ